MNRPQRPLVVAVVSAAAVLGIALGGNWVVARAHRQGIAASEQACEQTSVVRTATTWPGRAGRDQLLVPNGFRLAPLTVQWCRYGADGTVVGGWSLDAARTSQLVARLAAPPGGWSPDALAAKKIQPLDAATLASLAPSACTTAVPTEVLLLHYNEGEAVTVRIQRGSCDAASNGAITIRTPPEVNTTLDAYADA